MSIDRFRWTRAWLLWLLAFLAVELPAAIRKTGGTLSETVWSRWFPTKARRLVPCTFLLVLAVHFFDGGAHAWSGGLVVALSGAPVTFMVLWAERRSGVGLIGDVKAVLRLKAARDRLREAGKMGKLKTVVFALAGAVLTAVVAQVTGACPSLLAEGPAIVMAGAGGLLSYWSRKPLTAAAGKAVATGVIAGAFAAAVAAVAAKVDVVCGAGFVDKLPSLAMAGVWVGLGLWLKAPHESKG